MSDLIWRITKSAGNAGNTNMLAGLQAGRVQDVPADRVSIWWRGSTPFGSVLSEEVNGVRIYVRNQTLNIKSTSNTSNNDFGFLRPSSGSSNNFSISRIELIDRHGFGRVLYSYTA